VNTAFAPHLRQAAVVGLKSLDQHWLEISVEEQQKKRKQKGKSILLFQLVKLSRVCIEMTQHETQTSKQNISYNAFVRGTF